MLKYILILLTMIVFSFSFSFRDYYKTKLDRSAVIVKYIGCKSLSDYLAHHTPELTDDEFNSLFKTFCPRILETLDKWHMRKFGHAYENKTSYELLGEAFISSILQTTPQCLRVTNHPEWERGYIYYCKGGIETHVYDSFRVIAGGVICEDVLEGRLDNIALKTKDLVESFSTQIPVCTLEHLLIDTVLKIHKNKNKIRFGCEVLENCKALDFQSVFSP